MRTRHVLTLALLIAGTTAGLMAQDPLYDKSKLRDFHFTFKQTGWWNLLLATETSKVDMKVDLKVDGTTYADVGIRIKGLSSARRGGDKKPFNVSMDSFVSGQRLYGYKTINLNNAFADPTFTREVLTYELMQKYLPTPQTAYARVYLNETYWGCYVMAEQVNKDFLRRYYRDEDGVRFKGDPPIAQNVLGSATLQYRGSSASVNQTYYELKTSHTTAWNQLQNTIVKLTQGTTTNLRADISSVINVDRALWYLATCIVVHNMDSYIDGGHNFYMYFDPNTGLMNMVPWDVNMSFGTFRGGATAYALDPMKWVSTTDRPLMSRLMMVPEWKQRYLAHIRTILDESYDWDKFMKAANAKYQAVIDAAVKADTKKLYTYQDFTDNVTKDISLSRSLLSLGLKSLVDKRRTYLLAHKDISVPAPLITEAAYDPIVPAPGKAVWVRAKVTATGGVKSVSLFTATKAHAPFTQVAMFDDGNHRDGNANDGIYGVSFTAGTAYRETCFYIGATANNLALTFNPRRAEYAAFSVRATPTRTGPVLINELLADNETGDKDEKGEAEDWVELINTTSQVQDLTGHYLSDNILDPKKWAFPTGTKIPANGFIRIWCDNEPADGPLHATFKLSDEGEEVFLVDTDANSNKVLDGVLFATQKEDRSYGNVPDGGPHLFYIWDPSGNGPVTGTGTGVAVRFDVRRKGSPSGVDLKTASVPKVGNVFDLTISGGPANSAALLGLSVGVNPIDLGGLGPLILDTTTLVLVPIALDSSGLGGISAKLPASVGGITLFAQAAANELTNAMIIRISK